MHASAEDSQTTLATQRIVASEYDITIRTDKSFDD